MPTSYCAFCAAAGVSGPHDHFVRVNKNPNSKVTCPRLLASQCKCCNKFGHTAKHCGEAADRARLARQAATKAQREAFEQGKEMQVGQVMKVARPTTSKSSRAAAPTKKPVMSGFGCLPVDEVVSEEETEAEETESPWYVQGKRVDQQWPTLGGHQPRGRVVHDLWRQTAAAVREAPVEEENFWAKMASADQITWGKGGAVRWAVALGCEEEE